MKGQVFILMAFVIAMMLGELGNVYTYSQLPAQTEQTKLSDSIDLLKNIQNEIAFVNSINNSDTGAQSDFEQFVSNFTLQKDYNTTFTTYNSP